jgi:hypothetical protein
MALVAIVAVALIAINSLPDQPANVQAQSGSSVVAIAAAAFGVIGATVGAFFGITTARHAMDRAARDKKAARDPRRRH